MKLPTFSIVIPIHGDRDGYYPISSVVQQRYPRECFEILVVEDDNASVNERLLMEYSDVVRVVSHHDDRLERAISRNEGMKAAENEWVLWLDSDDELVSTTLHDLAHSILQYPDYKLFHWGGVVYWEPKVVGEEDYDARTTIRPTPGIEEAEVGMEPFKTGLIAAGHFMFHQEVFQTLGGLPEESSPYAFADRAKEEFLEFTDERNELYLVDTLGNPWGDDYYLMYKYTRKYKSKGLPLNLYLQHVRR